MSSTGNRDEMSRYGFTTHFQIVQLTLNLNKYFIQMPGISKPSLFGADLPGIVLTKITTPLADGFIGYFNATTGQNFFNITKTQGESMIKPNGVANNLSRKPEAMIEIIIFHQFRLHQLNTTRQVDSAHPLLFNIHSR